MKEVSFDPFSFGLREAEKAELTGADVSSTGHRWPKNQQGGVVHCVFGLGLGVRGLSRLKSVGFIKKSMEFHMNFT